MELMKNLLPAFILSATLMSPATFATCELKGEEPLIIGCTYQCNFLYRLRLTLSALGMGYSVRIMDMRDMSDAEAALASVDGVLMPGGADINPELYIPKVSEEYRQNFEQQRHLAVLNEEGKTRDPFEYGLLNKYSRDEQYKNLPFLGICRGMQMMSVVQGIPLYLDINTELGIENRKYVFDQIALEEGSLMNEIHGQKKLKAMKLHHQGLHLPYFRENQEKFPKVKISSFSHGRKIAESIEYTHRPAVGVQYHPEMSFTSASAPLFKWFLSKSCEYKNAVKGI